LTFIGFIHFSAQIQKVGCPVGNILSALLEGKSQIDVHEPIATSPQKPNKFNPNLVAASGGTLPIDPTIALFYL
jgi:hypothetical protein